MKNEKIVILLPSLEDVSPIKAALIVANHYKNIGYHVTVIALRSSNNKKASVASGIDIIEMNLSSWFKAPFYLCKLNRIIRELSPVLSMSYLLPADVMLAFCQTRKIANIRDILETSFSTRHFLFSLKLFRSIIKHSQFLYLGRFDEVIVMTKEMHDYYSPFVKSNVKLIHNFIDETRTFSLASCAIDYSFEKNIPYIVTVGSLIPRKCISDLLDKVEFCFENGLIFHTVILGEGPLKNELLNKTDNLRLSSNYIHFFGHQDNPMPFIKNANVFTLNSSSEGLSRAMLEASFLKTPCLIRDILGVKDFSDNCENVFIYNSNEEFYKQLQYILSDKLESSLGQCYRERYCLEKYSELP